MFLKKSSLVFLLVLVVILVFIVGVRYGQRVEKTNKIINYLISIPPSATLQPTQILPDLKFKTYEDNICGIKFLYPDQMKALNQASGAAHLSDSRTVTISFICVTDKENKSGLNSLINNLKDPKITSTELKFQNRTINAKNFDVEFDQEYFFSLINPNNHKTIYFGVTNTLYPLFEKSLEFLP